MPPRKQGAAETAGDGHRGAPTPSASARRAANAAALTTDTAPAAMTRWTGVLLHWTHARAGAAYAAAMAPLGLKPQQVGILQWLGACGPTAQRRLGESLHIDKVSMVGFLDGLEEAGLVERRPHATDRRAFEVHLTAAGRRHLAKAERITAQVEDTFFAPLTADERATLRTLLARLAASPTPPP